MKSETKAHQKAPATNGFGELFLEIGCEEIPAGMISAAARELQVILNKYLTMEKLVDGAEAIAFGAPRRLVAACPRVRLKQEDIQRQINGPPKSAAFDGHVAGEGAISVAHGEAVHHHHRADGYLDSRTSQPEHLRDVCVLKVELAG